MHKDVFHSDVARSGIKAGIDKVADAVKVTLGPGGHNVVLKTWDGAKVTKDGVSVARQISLPDVVENTGAQLLIEVATKANDQVGDGTTTATVLAQAIVDEGMRSLQSRSNAILVKKGIDKAALLAQTVVDKLSRKVSIEDGDRIKYIATISGNDEEVGEKVCQAFLAVGQDGAVTWEGSRSNETQLEAVSGLRFERGWSSPYFSNPPGSSLELENPVIVLFEKRVTSAQDMLTLLERLKAANRPILIISDSVDNDALATVVINKLRGSIDAVCVKSPGFGHRKKDLMDDMAILTGGQFISEEMGIEFKNIENKHLGQCERVLVTRDSTTIMGGKGSKEAIDARVAQIKKEYEENDNKYDREKLRERIGKLTGGVAVIKVGAGSESELREKLDRYEDAVHATKAALEGGTVPGGGVTLLHAALALETLRGETEDEQRGIDILKNALKVPFLTIAQNAGINGEYAYQRWLDTATEKVDGQLVLKNAKAGLDALKGEMVEDMEAAGILDPAKVTKTAIEAASSIGGLFLTLGAVVVDHPDKKKEG